MACEYVGMYFNKGVVMECVKEEAGNLDWKVVKHRNPQCGKYIH